MAQMSTSHHARNLFDKCTKKKKKNSNSISNSNFYFSTSNSIVNLSLICTDWSFLLTFPTQQNYYIEGQLPLLIQASAC